MRMPRVLLGAFLAGPVAFALPGCDSGKGVTDPAIQHATLRIVNLIPNAGGPLDVSVDGNTLVSGLGFEQVDAVSIDRQRLTLIQVSVAGGASNIISKPSISSAPSTTRWSSTGPRRNRLPFWWSTPSSIPAPAI
jgi:hypothetical protein